MSDTPDESEMTPGADTGYQTRPWHGALNPFEALFQHFTAEISKLRGTKTDAPPDPVEVAPEPPDPALVDTTTSTDPTPDDPAPADPAPAIPDAPSMPDSIAPPPVSESTTEPDVAPIIADLEADITKLKGLE
jgi:hypothetical protein